MLRTRLILPLAFASVAFMWGCQEQASSPVGPESSDILLNKAPHDHGVGGGGGGNDPPAETSTLGFADGMMTSDFAVTVTDRKNLLKAENTDFEHPIQMNFFADPTDPFADLGTCVGFRGTKSGVLPSPSEFDLLVEELSDPVTGGFFTMKVDKIGLEANGLPTIADVHFLDVERDGTLDGDAGSTRILLGSPFNQVDPVSVKWVSTNPDVFEFTGPVVVWANKVGGGGGAKSDRIIQCPGTGVHPNKVTVTVNR